MPGLRKSRGYGSDSNSAEGSLVDGPYADESTPLIPGKLGRLISGGRYRLIACGLLCLFALVNLYLHFTNCPPYPSTMNAIRRDWEKETTQHDILREEWRLQKLEHDVVEDEWKLQKEWHDKEVDRQIRKEEERQQRVQEEWAEKEERHRRECEEMERRETQRREYERQRWRHEIEDHDRIEEGRRKREEEERQRLNMFWGSVEAHTCTTYATREYTAQLMNLPATWQHRVEACKATPLEVHGISYFPKSCEDMGPGLVIGTWEINQHEPACATFWNWYKDKESSLSDAT